MFGHLIRYESLQFAIAFRPKPSIASAQDKSGNVNLNENNEDKTLSGERESREKKYTKTLPKQCVWLPRDSIFSENRDCLKI